MPLNLANYEQKAIEAIQAFWNNRVKAAQKQAEVGKIDSGERAGVTAGKNLNGFIALIAEIVEANGLPKADIHLAPGVVKLPGFFRPTKLWDLLVIHKGRLIAAIELKSQVGPSFGNNFNNRTEEAIGTAHDFWTAYKENAFGNHPKPFTGWLIIVEDAPKSNKPVRDGKLHFSTFPEFKKASYLERYNLLCLRLVKEGLYDAASVIATPRTAKATGEYRELSELTGLKNFVVSLASHIASEAAMRS